MELRILGVMTGTSCDGLDAVCVGFEKMKWRILWGKSAPIPTHLRQRVLQFQSPGSKHTAEDFLDLNAQLGDWYGKTLNRLLADRSPNQRAHIIANHGQTVAHFPGRKGGRKLGVTLQLGDPSRISVLTGKTVLSNFRDGDLAAGGQGAPLAPGAHHAFFSMIRKTKRQGPKQGGIAIHNLGGISNLTYLSPDLKEILAFDTGPANLWIDASVEEMTRGKAHFDRGGQIALSSNPNTKAIQKLLLSPFFLQSPPKSTGRDDFPYEVFCKEVPQLGPVRVATATALTVESIALAYKKWILGKGYPLKTIYLSGGGSKNLSIRNGLKKALPGIKIENISALGIASQWTEAAAFALLGFKTLKGEPLGGSWTGAVEFAPPAHIIPGKNWKEVLRFL